MRNRDLHLINKLMSLFLLGRLGFLKMNLWILGALFLRDGERSGLRVDRVDVQGDAARACPIDHDAREIPGTGAEIEHAVGAVGLEPSGEETAERPRQPGGVPDHLPAASSVYAGSRRTRG